MKVLMGEGEQFSHTDLSRKITSAPCPSLFREHLYIVVKDDAVI